MAGMTAKKQEAILVENKYGSSCGCDTAADDAFKVDEDMKQIIDFYKYFLITYRSRK